MIFLFKDYGLKQEVPGFATAQAWEDPDLQARVASNGLWATAKLQQEIPDLERLVPLFLKSIKAVANDLSAQGMANAIWACGTLTLDRALLDPVMPLLAANVRHRAADFDGQNTANTFWAAAKLKHQAPALLAALPALTAAAQGLAADMTEQQVANTVWAAGVLELEQPLAHPLFRAMAARAERSFGTFTPQQIANYCWGLARCGWRNATLLAAVAAHVSSQSPAWQDADAQKSLPMIAGAFARLRLRSGSMLRTIAKRVPRMLERLTPWSVCVLTWSYAELNATESFTALDDLLTAEVARRGLSADLVSCSYVSPSEWDELRR